jgi:Lrp/AsnC family transcriptional regulator, leucine-responsive regulatory protein
MDVDEIDRAILAALTADARITIRDLAADVGLSRSATSERIRRLEQAGVIRGYTTVLDLDKLDRPVHAFVRVRAPDPGPSAITDVLDSTRELTDWHHVTGEDCFIAKVVTRDIAHLERVVSMLARLGPTTTSVVFSSRLTNRVVIPPRDGGSAD